MWCNYGDAVISHFLNHEGDDDFNSSLLVPRTYDYVDSYDHSLDSASYFPANAKQAHTAAIEQRILNGWAFFGIIISIVLCVACFIPYGFCYFAITPRFAIISGLHNYSFYLGLTHVRAAPVAYFPQVSAFRKKTADKFTLLTRKVTGGVTLEFFSAWICSFESFTTQHASMGCHQLLTITTALRLLGIGTALSGTLTALAGILLVYFLTVSRTCASRTGTIMLLVLSPLSVGSTFAAFVLLLNAESRLFLSTTSIDLTSGSTAFFSSLSQVRPRITITYGPFALMPMLVMVWQIGLLMFIQNITPTQRVQRHAYEKANGDRTSDPLLCHPSP